MSAYVPINVGAYVSAYAGAISGLTTSGWLIDSVHADYGTVTEVAGAFAEAFDTVWDNAADLNNLEIQAISQVVSENFAHRAPGPQANATFALASNWLTTAGACAAVVLQSDAYFAGQGIDPGTPGGGGTLVSFNGRTAPAVIPTAGDYSADEVTSAVDGPHVSDSLAANKAAAATALSTANAAGVLAATAESDAATAQTTANAAGAAATAAQGTANTAVTNAAAAQTTANTGVTNAAAAQTTANTAVTNAAAAQTTANTAVTNAATADGKAVAAQQPLKGLVNVDPTFAGGSSTGSESKPFTTIAAAFAALTGAGYTRGKVVLCPGANCVENVTYPASGDWEIASPMVYGVFAATITGNVDASCAASRRAVLNSVSVTGNLTGNCAGGFQRVLVLNGSSIGGTITLTQSGSGSNRLITGSVVNEFSGAGSLQNFLTGAVSVAGQFTGSSCIFGTSLTVTTTSSFVDCLMPPTTTFNGAGGASFYLQGCANTVGGSLAFTVTGGGSLTLQCDGTTLEEFTRVGLNITGTVLMQSFMGGRSSTTTQTTNVGVTPLLGKLPAGLQVVDACLTLLANGGATAGNAVLNVTYTDATGTLVTEAVTTTLNVAGAVGSKARGTLPFSQNGATTPSFSVTGITNATALSYKCDVAMRQAS